MPYAKNDGVKIYYELVGVGPPLVLAHGGMWSHNMWHDFGYVTALNQTYSLILIDARGHGASSKPHESDAYQVEMMVKDVTCVLDALRITRCHFMGWSMGGKTGFGMVKFTPERLLSLIVIGMHPYPSGVEDPLLPRLEQEGMAWVERSPWAQRLTNEANKRLLENDVDATKARLVQGKSGPDLSEDLRQTSTPTLMIAGESEGDFDDARRCASEIPNSVFVAIPGEGHVETIMRIDLILPRVKSFLAELNP